jgi:predicted nucleic acid-binding protein
MTILDTNVVSEVMAPSPSEMVVRWISSQRLLDELFITAVTVAEILYGVEVLSGGKRRDRLHQQAEAMFAEDFLGRVLPFDEQAARAFASIAAARRRQGKPISKFDAQIAAIARANGATLATRNTGDFEGCGVRLVNPWEG